MLTCGSKTVGDYFLALAPFAVALGGIFLAFWQFQQTTKLKRFELTFLAKQKAYSDVMTRQLAVANLLAESHERDFRLPSLKAALAEMDTSLFSVEPFFVVTDREWLYQQMEKFHERGQPIYNEKDPDARKSLIVAFSDWYRKELRPGIFDRLFSEHEVRVAAKKT